MWRTVCCTDARWVWREAHSGWCQQGCQRWVDVEPCSLHRHQSNDCVIANYYGRSCRLHVCQPLFRIHLGDPSRYLQGGSVTRNRESEVSCIFWFHHILTFWLITAFFWLTRLNALIDWHTNLNAESSFEFHSNVVFTSSLSDETLFSRTLCEQFHW